MHAHYYRQKRFVRRASVWDDQANVDKLIALWNEGCSSGIIADKIGGGVTRSGILGKLHRLGLLAANDKPRQSRTRKSYGEVSKRTREIRKVGNQKMQTRIVERPRPVIVPRPPKILPAAERAAQIVPRHLDIMQLTSRTCKWPYGDGPYTYCGHPATHGPYCEGHHDLAHEALPANPPTVWFTPRGVPVVWFKRRAA